MADISMCQGGKCPRKETCYRFTAPANPYRQSYGSFDIMFEGKECEAFLSNEGRGESKEAAR